MVADMPRWRVTTNAAGGERAVPNTANNDRSTGLVRPIQADAGGEFSAVGAL